MKRKNLLVLTIGVLLITSCVSSKEYRLRLDEIKGLQGDASTLRQQLKDAEERIAELNAAKDDLERQIKILDEQNKAIKNVLEAKRSKLMQEVVDLRTEMAEMRAQAEALEREKARAIEEKEKAVAQIKGTYDSLVHELKQEIKEGEIQISQLRDKLTVNMVEKILFSSGSAVIKKNGKKVLNRVADILKKVSGQQIKVEGHTDNVPIGAALMERFPSNWELSTARATTVVRYLQERGVNPELLSAEGYSEYRPIAPNDTEEERAKNRRIEIVLLPIDVNR